MKLLMDKSSIVGAFLHLEDEEFGEDLTFQGEKFHIPSLETCMERFEDSLEGILSVLDLKVRDIICVCDPGVPCKQRKAILKEYKSKKRLAPKEFGIRRKEVFAAVDEWMKARGAIIATPKNTAEADDLLNELANRFPETIILTRDKDMLACDTNVFLVGKSGNNEINPTKFPVARELIHAYRAICVGDTSDGLGSGAKGFGPKTWDKMLELFGDDSGVDIDNMLRDGGVPVKLGEPPREGFSPLKGLVGQFPKFQLLLDQADHLYKIYKCLQFFPVPAHQVKWEGGMEAGRDVLVTAANYEEAVLELAKEKFDYAVIDYESDVCPESRAWSKTSGVKVDVMGQEIAGMGLRVNNKNFYFSVDHKDTDNITLSQLEHVLEILWGKVIYAHNAAFEHILTFNHFGAMLPNAIDTSIMASYVDENDYLNLKHLSSKWLSYQQATFVETLDGRSGMREIPGVEVLRYGLDDVIATDGLQHLFATIMQYEGTLETFHQVENDALYFTTRCFINGVDFDKKKFRELKRINDNNIVESWEKLSDMLLDLDWEGGEFVPVSNMNMGTLNKIHKAVHGKELEDITAVKMAIRMMDDRELAKLAEDKDYEMINEYYRRHWKPAAEFNVRSPKQMSRLLYDVLKLPIRVRNPPTVRMKKAGEKGNPASSEIAIQNSIAYKDTTEHVELLKLLLEHKGYLTKESLFLSKYPHYVHWKTGKIHASLRQSATTTRRFSCSAPNLQQLPKRAGKEFRSMLQAPPGYYFVALDFSGQELRLAADDSRDPNFLSCYIGDNKRDVHSLTGLGIANKTGLDLTYEEFEARIQEEESEAEESRTIGKKINFTCQYGAMAPKVAQTLCIPEPAAQAHIDSRAEAFPVLIQRVKEHNRECRKRGYATTMLGGRRHLGGHKYYGSSKAIDIQAADRLAYSMRIQGSAAEMTKLVMGRMVRDRVFNSDDVLPFTMVHDELVLCVKIPVIHEVMPGLVDMMCQPYADMIIPMETAPEYGTHFGSLKKYKGE